MLIVRLRLIYSHIFSSEYRMEMKKLFQNLIPHHSATVAPAVVLPTRKKSPQNHQQQRYPSPQFTAGNYNGRPTPA